VGGPRAHLLRAAGQERRSFSGGAAASRAWPAEPQRPSRQVPVVVGLVVLFVIARAAELF
jgi:hypothetical protein